VTQDNVVTIAPLAIRRLKRWAAAWKQAAKRERYLRRVAWADMEFWRARCRQVENDAHDAE